MFYIFYNCSGLTSITIGNSVTYIGYGAFEGCNAIKTLSLNCATIGSWFSGKSSIEELTLGDGVITIDNQAFQGCTNLATIEIGKNVTTIGERSFANIDKLTDVYCYAEDVPNTARTAFENSYIDYATLHVPYGALDMYKSTGPWNGFKNIVGIDGTQRTFNLIYKVDDEVYKIEEIKEGEAITPEAEPTKEGYTFSGWSEIPETMPSHDVTVTGTFTINNYKLTYVVDGEEYKIYDVEYGATITPEAEPTKEGYTFSGWSEIPETMPAHDVTVTGTFSINKYKLTYLIDGEEYKAYELEYGTTITPEAEPTKEGYTFSGWSEIPETMPAHDVTVTSTFSINSYKLTYMIDDNVYKEVMYEYGATITPEPQPEGDYARFEWIGVPETMPANDVVVYASYETGIIDLLTLQGVKAIYAPNGKKLDKPQKGLNIVVMQDGTVKKIKR